MRYVLSMIILVALLVYFDRDDRAVVRLYDTQIPSHPPSCLSLSVIPPNRQISDSLRSKYDFDDQCRYRLEVTYTQNIHCNSNQNSDKKALSAFPTSFIRLEVRHGMKLLYSYYLDLSQNAKGTDAANALDRLRADLHM